MDSPQTALSDELRSLNEAYIRKVNEAVEHDRRDLVQELTDAYFADAQKVISGSANS